MTSNVVPPATCRTCRAAIWWADTEGGKRIPINAEPDPAGNVVIIREGEPGRRSPLIRVLPPDVLLLDDPVRYVSHFATCSAASEWRKRGKT